MSTIRNATFTAFALLTSITAASAATSKVMPAHANLSDVYVQQSSMSPALPNIFSFTSFGNDGPYTVLNKAPHNGFDLSGNGVHPPIGPITD